MVGIDRVVPRGEMSKVHPCSSRAPSARGAMRVPRPRPTVCCAKPTRRSIPAGRQRPFGEAELKTAGITMLVVIHEMRFARDARIA